MSTPMTGLPGFQWCPGMAYSVNGRVRRVHYRTGEPCLDDPCTGGALLVLLGAEAVRVWHSAVPADVGTDQAWIADLTTEATREQRGRVSTYPTLGRACFAVAVALGKWA